ncbi:hypothetical protein [Thermocatellispora tengchongensis]|uniref:hypothetical protein n=1 Tax=Thermocatellispora tengchongensis TaxID=1073253 RepID=UPI003634B2EF
MATSDPVRRVVAYLGSTKNIAGCALALLGLGAHFLGLAGSLWPVVVAGLYGVGALLAPPERVRLTVSVSAETEAEARRLAADLDALLARAARVHRFPADVLERLEALGEVLRGVLARAEVLTSSPTTCTSSRRRSATTCRRAWRRTPTCPGRTRSPGARRPGAARTRSCWRSSTCSTARSARWRRPCTAAMSRRCATRAGSCATASAAPPWTCETRWTWDSPDLDSPDL